jgi:hypothetical protein
MSNSDEPEEPRVEVLRAEVRVLMVSSGQVTLSAARQLDTVEPTAIEPFGRVRIDKDPTGQMIEVIGSADGALARSVTSRKLFKCSRNARGEGQCAEYKRLRRADDAALQVLNNQARQAGRTPPLPVPGSTPTSQALIDHLDHEWWGYTGEKALYEAWEKLPLIVLAG